MFIRLLLLFTLVPLLELWLLLRVGGVIGAAETILLVIVTGAVGAWFARQQGLMVLTAFQRAGARGEMPTDPIIDGLMILAGGAMLITPGIVTDLIGLTLVLPFTRPFLREALKRGLARRVTVVGGTAGFGYTVYSPPSDGPVPPPGQTVRPRPRADRDDKDDVIDV